MNDSASKPILTTDDLTARWATTAGTLRRRMKRLNLPAVNVGTAKEPDYRFRLSAIERWEQENEGTTGNESREAAPVPSGAPPGLERYDAFGPKGRKKGPGREGHVWAANRCP